MILHHSFKVFHAVIDGVVIMPKTEGWGKIEDKLKPESIADNYWNMAHQDPSCWTFELNIASRGAAGNMVSI
jgi:hypothetical protein